MNNTRFLKIVIVFLLLINLGAISFMWCNRPHHNDQVGGFFEKELQFTPKQVALFDKLKDEHRTEMEVLKSESKELHDAYFDLLKNPSVNPISVTQKAAEIAKVKEKEELVTFYHFQKVRAICNENQKIKFDQIIREAARMMAPPKGPREGQGPPPGPRGENGPPPPPRANE